MTAKIKSEFQKRREEICKFYYYSIGQEIKRRRLEMKLTQEALASEIISNTYLSKVENNQAMLNHDNSILIMEKLDMDISRTAFPEDAIEYLDKAIEYLFFRDIENYSLLIEKISKYNFSILLEIIKLGYHVLCCDLESSERIFNEVFRYLNNLDNYGFSVFLIFGIYHYIGSSKFNEAKKIIDMIEGKLYNDLMIYALFSHGKFIVYGNVGLVMIGSESKNIALQIFSKYYNIKRVNEVFMWTQIFAIYEGYTKEQHTNFEMLDYLPDEERNLYLILLSMQSDNPDKYLDSLIKKGDLYLLGLFLKAKRYLNENNQIEYKKIFKEIDSNFYIIKPKIDYCKMLNLIKNKNEPLLKDYLINTVLPEAINKQNIYFSRLINNRIVENLEKRSRYKDSTTYRTKIDNMVKENKK